MNRLAVVAVCVLAACSRSGGGSPDELPDGFPPDLPLPRGAEVVESTSSDEGAVVYLRTDEPDDRVVALIRKGLPDAGWSLRSCLRTPASPEPVVTIVADKGGRAVSYSIGYSPATAPDGKRYDLFVSVAERADARGSPLPCDL